MPWYSKGFASVIYYNEKRGRIKMCAENRPDVKAVMDNLRKPMPFVKKIGLIIKNSALKIIRLKGCCEHPGEPGC
jgi:hypothetical protein